MMSEVSTIGHFKIEPVFLNGTLLELVLSFKCSPSQVVFKAKDTKVNHGIRKNSLAKYKLFD